MIASLFFMLIGAILGYAIHKLIKSIAIVIFIIMMIGIFYKVMT